MFERIVITGLGVVSAAGVGTAALLKVLRDGQSCNRGLEVFDTTGLACRFGASTNAFEPRESPVHRAVFSNCGARVSKYNRPL